LEYLKKEFAKFDLEKYQYVVLGCTHFTYFEKLIQENFPILQPVDGNEGTARHLKNTLANLNLLNSTRKGTLKFVESGKYVHNEARFLRYLGR
jgi:glutamate racemase